MLFAVAPLVGARIEICHFTDGSYYTVVAPLVGARIEISCAEHIKADQESLPSWERGLK